MLSAVVKSPRRVAKQSHWRCDSAWILAAHHDASRLSDNLSTA